MQTSSIRTVELVAVAVGQPTVIGSNRKGEVVSGIRKREIAGPEVHVGLLNIAGDRQADLRNHGGVDKAVYCYPSEHRAFWAAEIGYDATEAPFGENLSTIGITEEEACIGDIWRWGAATLQICQPRWPCYKLALHSGRVDMIKRFVAAGRCGWYLRVLEAGMAPVAGPIVQETRDPLGISVAMAFAAARGELGAEDVERVNAHPLLAEAWRR